MSSPANPSSRSSNSHDAAPTPQPSSPMQPAQLPQPPLPAAHASSPVPPSPTRSSTPSAPSYSPLTPPLPDTSTHLPTIPDLPPLSPNNRQRPRQSQRQQPKPPAPLRIAQPPPVPIAEDTNPDVVALRAALDVLQLQRQRALRDIAALREGKEKAVADPQGFARSLERGELSSEGRGQVYELRVPDIYAGGYDGEEEDEDETMGEDGGEGQRLRGDGEAKGKFEPLPEAQDVVRCPPVNWDKYQVVGAALDRLHEEQRARPADGNGGGGGLDHAVVAPYRPFIDGIEQVSSIGKSAQRKRGG